MKCLHMKFKLFSENQISKFSFHNGNPKKNIFFFWKKKVFRIKLFFKKLNNKKKFWPIFSKKNLFEKVSLSHKAFSVNE